MIKANVNKWNSDTHIMGNFKQIAAEASVLIKSVYNSIAAGDEDAAEVFREHLIEFLNDDELMHMKADKEERKQ